MGEEIRGPDRRLIRLCVSGPSFLDLCRQLHDAPGTVRCAMELPKDARVIAVKGRDFRCDVLDLFIESEEFDPVPDGADVPEKLFWFERVEPGEGGD